MATFKDPTQTFAPIEVVERLLGILEYCGYKPIVYLSSGEDLATYLDSFGFDIYTLTLDPSRAFSASGKSVLVLPNGNRSHLSPTAH